MTAPLDPSLDSLTQVATFLRTRREAVLHSWRTRCGSDPSLRTTASLSREEFNNKVPFLLNVLEQRLSEQPEQEQVPQLAAEHGLDRWQKGYALPELMQEMQLLDQVLLEELRRLWPLFRATPLALVAQAYEHLARFSQQISRASLEQYTDLQRGQAMSRVNTLEQALTHLTQVGQQRTDLLRHSSHDLRGSFAVIQGASTLLNQMGASEPDRQVMLEMILRNVANSQTLLTQLMDLSRLEAGQEQLHIETIPVGQLLTRLVEDYQPLAQERGLVLLADGPLELAVECDGVHLMRVIQNLVLNALQHTLTGWVSVCWSQEGESRWLISVQDSGPGLPTAEQSGSLAQILAPSPESTAAFGLPNPAADARQARTTQAASSAFGHKGEGIGLAIVKGLCELLRGSLEIESQPGQGTLFRIRLSMQWQP